MQHKERVPFGPAWLAVDYWRQRERSGGAAPGVWSRCLRRAGASLRQGSGLAFGALVAARLVSSCRAMGSIRLVPQPHSNWSKDTAARAQRQLADSDGAGRDLKFC